MTERRFEKVARRAVRRLAIASTLERLASSAVVVFPILAVAALAGWLFDHPVLEVWHIAAAAFVWLSANIVLGWIRRPSAAAALAAWDENAARDEIFTSALCFEENPEPSTAEQLHLLKAVRRLDEDEQNLRRDLPAHVPHRVWILPILAAVLVSVVPAQTSAIGDRVVDEAERQRALDAAEQLAQQADIDHIEKDGLDEEEKKKLKELEDSLQESTDRLKELGDDETARDVLAELEEKAHEAEKLADALEGSDEGLSSEMIAELERHADTTEFGSALRSEELNDIADEATELQKKLENKELSREEEARFEESLRKAMKKASEQDKKTPVGEELKEALQRLTKNKPKQAAKNFQKIAQNALQQQQRQLAQQQLQQLAKQLRQAGQKIFGGNQQGIQKLAQLQQQGLKQLNLQNGQQIKIAMPMGQGQQNGKPMALGNGKPGNQPPQGLTPIPGQPGNGQPQSIIPGTGQGQLAGQIPIPGAGQTPGAGAGQTPGAGQGAPIPGAGAGAQGAGAGVGGLQAGTGTAGYGNTATKPFEAQKQGVVQGQINAEGQSMVRQIDPGSHNEDAERKYKQLVAETLRLEEEALADEQLPASRRQQVLHYLTALRRQLVDK